MGLKIVQRLCIGQLPDCLFLVKVVSLATVCVTTLIVWFVGALGKLRGVQIGETLPEKTISSPMLSVVLVSGLGSFDSGDIAFETLPMQLMMLPYSDDD